MRGTRTQGIGAAAAATLLLVLTGCGSESATAPAPPTQGNVLDAAEVLTDQQEQELNALIEDRNRSTDAARVAVLTVENASGPIEDYARIVATEWEVGDDGANNGVLIVADTAERELRVETADGVREQFSDDEAEDVVEDVLEPAFADEEYAQGLTEAVEQIYLYADGQEPPSDPFAWVLPASIVGAMVAFFGIVVAVIVRDSRRRRRLADEEIRAAEEADPDLHLTDEQREAYRKYRYNHRKDDAVTNPALWLPLYIANPALYSGGSSGTTSGSSFNGGGGFTGGGASGSY
ncbi:TPM domain-containing protein [Arthrobacter sp. EH-1B-1]|uniref:TPM domain-containing protein n=1 Tax=Arthrobacter vasquezii TaxID=2977629 RepID=A0ABT6CYI4_9MICC|nr:TPM domain-containing protein [Arthrobacter vasquezii]MDF9279131.1 TPM domain-containing protein [Arthrobacter vasquezii]